MKLKIAEQDIIYLSYDEPNAEENYADLLTKVPWAKRVHGIKGSDAAHKECARISETDRFITVDGDNKISQSFIDQVLDFDEHTDLEHSVISWCGENIINGLMYGNGGLKCWPKKHVLEMRTHENADPNNPQAQVDFCWDLNYIQQNSTYSKVYNNSTPQQAWRAGFREGVKMSLDQGVRVDKETFLNGHWKNLHRLWIWLMVGADVKNGDWAILGAREGLEMTMCSDWDYIQVRDFEYLNQLWGDRNNLPGDVLHTEIFNLGNRLIDELNIPIAIQPLLPDQSKFFKAVYQNPSRSSTQQFIDKEV
jgi:hypothetical protein